MKTWYIIGGLIVAYLVFKPKRMKEKAEDNEDARILQSQAAIPPIGAPNLQGDVGAYNDM